VAPRWLSLWLAAFADLGDEPPTAPQTARLASAPPFGGCELGSARRYPSLCILNIPHQQAFQGHDNFFMFAAFCCFLLLFVV
jgi:hypothetical protein